MILINVFIMILLTSLTGTLIFGFWKLMSAVLERFGELRLVSSLLHAVLIFHLLPVVFMCLVYCRGAFEEREAGSFLSATPMLIRLSELLAVVWLAGFLVEILRYLWQQKIRSVERKISVPGGGCAREAVRRVRGRLGIAEEIPVYELAICKCPFITGFNRCRIFIPKRIEDEKELEMILEHELFHYVQKDLYLKRLCAWIVRIQWFNPCVHFLVRQVDSWGDSLCDYHMCYQSAGHWDMKEYFDVVIKYTERKERRGFYGDMRMGRSRKEIWRRMERMKRLKKENGAKKGMKRVSVMLLTVCFVMASAVTSLAAGRGIEQLYASMYGMSVARIQETVAEEEFEEYTRARSGDLEIVETDETVNLDAKGLNTYEWEVRAGVIYETGLFWATKGDEIAVSASPSPASSKIGMGLDQPDGYLRGISGTGPLAHTFTVSKTGFHRVYVENLGSSTISVGVVVSR